jgi:hypothetical protein
MHLFFSALLILALPSFAFAHEEADWIRQQQLKNRMGEFCCGTQDCAPVNKVDFISGPGGYIITRKERGPREEHIPYSEAMPMSIDGRLWICRKQDGSRRCVFDQPPGM